jgi:glycosyltransferase involved in cell wall biosynthesis
MKLCFVVQRYGEEVTGGSELHCRWLAQRLARRHSVKVLTTCALDYREWRNHYPPGVTTIAGVPVVRHLVRRPRSPRRFTQVSDLVFLDEHTLEDETDWVVENGPYSPDLLRGVRRAALHSDLFLFYCYRYYPTFFGLPPVKSRAVLVPTAEEDPAVQLPVFRDLLRMPAGILYLTPEEKALVQQASGNHGVPSAVIGSGVEPPQGWQSLDARARFALPERYLLYVGRIDPNKGAPQLFRYYEWLAAEWPELPPLVLIGHAAVPVPQHPKIRHLGYVAEPEKYALLACAELLVMPSPYESLSLIVLEAWAMARPVLVNAACRVLVGQCLRSGGGLFYADYAEFGEALRLLCSRSEARSRLGESGREFVRRECDWNVVEGRVESFLEARSRPG